jgi:hypothetical protein
VKLFVIKTQSRVRSVMGVSQRGGVVVCREVSGEKVEDVVLAGLLNACRWNFAGDSLRFRAVLALATPSIATRAF